MADWRSERDAALLTLEREKRASARVDAADILCELAAEDDSRAAELAELVPRLIADRDDDVRCAGLALAGLTLPSEEAHTLYLRHLTDASARMRAEAAGRLADTARPEVRGALAAVLEDPHLEVRFEAARGMAALRHRSGLEVLIEALDDDVLRFRALAALAILGDTTALPAIQRVFRKWFIPVFDRTQAAGALAKLGDTQGIAHLVKRTEKKWSIDRAMAVELLGEVNAPGAFERLTSIANDAADTARGAAARGLGRLGNSAALSTLKKLMTDETLSDDLRLDAAEGLFLLDPAALATESERLRPSLKSTEARIELDLLLKSPPVSASFGGV